MPLLGLSEKLICLLLTGEQILTADIDLSLADFFEVSPIELLRVQSDYHLAVRECAEKEHALAA